MIPRPRGSLAPLSPPEGRGLDRSESALRHLRLLVIDDNAQMQIIIGAVLAAAGVRHLHYAVNGLRGLEAVDHFRPDVVYVDYEMPVMNGLDFISVIRRPDSQNCFLPIIMLTGHSDMARLTQARDRGVTEFLAKPVTARDILKRLEAVIFNPRPFVNCTGFFGPDRRRRDDPAYRGPERRMADAFELGC